jgi:hypothetical protein
VFDGRIILMLYTMQGVCHRPGAIISGCDDGNGYRQFFRD